MISDVLSDLRESLDTYLEMYPDLYIGEIRERIIKLRDEAEEIRIILDTPPVWVRR